jgi:hypothetical protein
MEFSYVPLDNPLLIPIFLWKVTAGSMLTFLLNVDLLVKVNSFPWIGVPTLFLIDPGVPICIESAVPGII